MVFNECIKRKLDCISARDLMYYEPTTALQEREEYVGSLSLDLRKLFALIKKELSVLESIANAADECLDEKGDAEALFFQYARQSWLVASLETSFWFYVNDAFDGFDGTEFKIRKGYRVIRTYTVCAGMVLLHEGFPEVSLS